MTSTATTTFREARDLLLSRRESYGDAVRDFSWPRFDGPFNWAVDWFDAVAAGNDRRALWIVREDGSEQAWTFDELRLASDRVAAWLAGLGVVKGSRVMLMLGNQVELWQAVLAVMKLGAVVLPTTTALGTHDLQDRVDRGRVSHVVANAADAPKLDGVTGELVRVVVGEPREGWRTYAEAHDIAQPAPFPTVTSADDTLLVYFTSGTTSRPKLVEHDQVSYPVGHLSTAYWLGLQPGDVHLNVSSPGWAKHAWSCLFAPWIAEATVFATDYARFDAARLLEQVRRCGVTTLCAPPTVWRMLVQQDLSAGPGSLREVLAAGEPLNPEVITQVRDAWGLTVRDGFGQTETTAQVGNTPGQPVKPGSMGRPLPGMPVVLVDPLTGQPADEGEICLDLSRRPVGLMVGYTDDAERQAGAMADGYYHSGDVATRDADGYITYVGRTDDVFKASDYKISPFELESVLIEHPAVAEAAVVPAPDPVRLAVPKAYVTLAAGWEPDEATALSVLRHCRERLAPYKRVRRIEFADLPKNVAGKIRRVELRNREQELVDGGTTAPAEWRDEQLPELRA